MNERGERGIAHFAGHPERRIPGMTMLTHTRSPFERAPYLSRRREAAGANVQAHLSMIKRFCMWASMAGLAGGALAAIIALKAAIHLSRFNYH